METKINSKVSMNNEFQYIIHDLITNETVQQMKNYRQHCQTSCFEHCYNVAYYCYLICKKYNLDYKSVTRSAMLHDLFLYDWREKSSTHRFHAFHHGKVACQNACEFFDLTQKEKDMIIRHMWPVTLAFPTSIEGFILTFVDKYCAILETLKSIKLYLSNKKVLRYAYLMIGFIIFRKK